MSEIALFPLSSILMPWGGCPYKYSSSDIWISSRGACARTRVWRDLAQAGFRGIGRLA